MLKVMERHAACNDEVALFPPSLPLSLDAMRERKQALEEVLDRAKKAQNRDEKTKAEEEVRAEKTRLQALALEEVNTSIAETWGEWERKLESVLAETQSALDAAAALMVLRKSLPRRRKN